MPVYRYGCRQCEHEEDGYRTVEERRNSPLCCGERMYIVICPAFVQDDIEPYVSPATGRIIGSKSKRRDDFKRSQTRPWEGLEAEKKEAARRRKHIEDKHDAKLTDAAYRAFHALPPSKRKVLEGSE
jgi:hypothetical protein